MREIVAALTMTMVAAAAVGAEPIVLDLQANHPNGSVLIVKSMERGPDSTTLEIVVTSADREIELNRGDSMVLIDSSGARHLLVPPADNEEIVIPPNSRLTGEMVFSGRLDPAAERVVLSTNDGVGGSATSAQTSRPVFRLELPLSGGTPSVEPPTTAAAPAGEPAGQTATSPGGGRVYPVDEQVNHPNGTVLLVRSLETTADGVLIDLKVTSGDREIDLNPSNSMQLIDERGARYRVVAPPDNPNITLPSATSIEGKVFFAGRLQPGVGRVTLSINDGVGGSTSNRFSSRPQFRVEIPLEG